jgi:hypothetical protein
MSLHQIIGYGILTLAVWKLIQRRAFTKANSLNVSGPDKDHWFKGSLFSGVKVSHMRYSSS